MQRFINFIQKIIAKHPYWILGASFFVLSIYFGYPKLLNQHARSSHTWRQADASAIAANYYRSDLKFFQPRIYNRRTGDGFTVGEFTGTYFLAAIAYKAFGVQPWILRSIHLLFFLVGFLALYRITLFFTREKWISYWVPLLFLSAPLLTFYGITTLPDVPALSCVFVAWACFCHFADTQKSKWWWLGCSAFILAGLLKVTMLMSLFALIAMYVLHLLGWLPLATKGEKHGDLLPSSMKKAIGGLLLIFCLVAAWYIYAIQYKEIHEAQYFTSRTHPIWMKENMKVFTYVYFRTLFTWSAFIFFPLTFIGVGLLAMLLFFGRHKPNSFLQGMSFLTFLGSLSIYILWYYQFIDHDYYFIVMYVFPLFLLLAGFDLFKKHFKHIFNSQSLKVILYLFLMMNILFAKKTMNMRYGGKMDYIPNQELAEAEFHTYLNEKNISKDALVLSVPDKSPNATLTLLNRPGYTEWVDHRGPRFNDTFIRKWIKKGVYYLIVNDPNYLKKPHIKPFLTNEIGSYKNIKIYTLNTEQ